MGPTQSFYLACSLVVLIAMATALGWCLWQVVRMAWPSRANRRRWREKDRFVKTPVREHLPLKRVGTG